MQEPDELPVAELDRLAASFQQPTLLSGLNPEQLAAVTLPPQPALILAGAGSGKTRVLTTRIAWLIQTRQVSPAGVLAVTFTNKAAKEMLARLSGDAADQPARHVDRHVPRPVQPLPAHALPRRGAAADVPDPRLGRPARGGQAAAEGPADRRRAATPRDRPRGSSTAARRRACARRTSRSTPTSTAGWSSSTASTTSSASAKASSTSPSCCCARTSCWRATSRCASTTRRASGTSSSTSSRTPTSCSTSG